MSKCDGVYTHYNLQGLVGFPGDDAADGPQGATGPPGEQVQKFI